MFNRFPPRIVVAVSLLTVAGFALGCGQESPAGPSPAPNGPSSPAPAGPSPPTLAVPTILSVSPALGSTGGGARVMVTGTGLQRGVRVTLGSTTVSTGYDPRNTDRVYLTTPPHAAGSVDVVVTNPDGQTGVARAAYMFTSPDSFEVNGDWQGGAITGHEAFTFTVVNGFVVSMSCWTSGLVVLSPPPPIQRGAFSYSGADGVSISGAMVSPNEAAGFVNVGPCINADWFATRE